MNKLIAIFFGFALLVVVPRVAHAGVGYVCASENYPASLPGNGTKGSVWVNLYAGPSCTGSYLSSGYICSTGAVSSVSCDPSYLYSETQLGALSQNLQRAAAANQKVFWYQGQGSYYNNIELIYFYAGGY